MAYRLEKKLRGRELNPGLLRDRQKYYHGRWLQVQLVADRQQQMFDQVFGLTA